MEIHCLTDTLKKTIDSEKWRQLETWCATAAKKVYADNKARQISKFERLTSQTHKTSRTDNDRVVRNLSNRVLTEEEKDVLALGLNYAITPKQIPMLDIIAATEATASHLDEEKAQKLGLEVSSVLNSARPLKKNLSGKLQKAIRDLRRDKNITILPADKSNATVVMNRSDYTTKMADLLEDPAYKKLKRNPTTGVENRISSALNELEQKGHLSKNNACHSPPLSPQPHKSTASPRSIRKVSPSNQLSLPLAHLPTN